MALSARREPSVTAQANVHSYQINPVHGGKLAASIKGVIYASGCEFDTFEAEISGDTAIEKSYECVVLPTVTLVGHIAHLRRFRDRDLEVVVRYLADWECKFFEFFDCMVPQIELARAPVNENGDFDATFADFSPEQTSPLRHKGELWVVLRDAKTWNLIGAGLRPTRELRARSDMLSIRPFYPPPVEFELVLPSSSVPAPLSARQSGSFSPTLLLTLNCILPLTASTTTWSPWSTSPSRIFSASGS